MENRYELVTKILALQFNFKKGFLRTWRQHFPSFSYKSNASLYHHCLVAFLERTNILAIVFHIFSHVNDFFSLSDIRQLTFLVNLHKPINYFPVPPYLVASDETLDCRNDACPLYPLSLRQLLRKAELISRFI